MRVRRRMEDSLERDIRDHIEMETHENIERGMSSVGARYVLAYGWNSRSHRAAVPRG
jgi:hypothetical protein